MKNLIIAFMMTISGYADADNYAMYISASDVSQPKKIIETVVTLTQSLKSGDSFEIYTTDNQNIELISSVKIPMDEAFVNKSSAVQRFSQKLLLPPLVDALKSTQSQQSQNYNGIMIQPIARHISKMEYKIKAVVYGKPFAASMPLDQGYPSLGHISSAISLSEFGLKGPSDYNNTTQGHELYWVFGNQIRYRNNHHEMGLKQFFTAFLLESGGIKLCAFQSNLAQVTSDCNPMEYKLPDNPKVEFTVVRPQVPGQEASLDWLTTSNVESVAAQSFTAHQFEIGLTWGDANTDLDLYVFHPQHTKPLYFGQASASWGYLTKDFQTSPNVGQNNGFETIVLTSPEAIPDIRALKVFVNTYRSSGENELMFNVRIKMDDKVYNKSFSLPKTKGNGGKDVENGNYWREISISDILSIN